MFYRNYRGRTWKKQKTCLGNLLWCLEQLVNNSLQFFSITWTRFAKLCSLCQNESNIQYCTLQNCTLQCSKFSLCKNKPKMCILYCNWIDLTSMSPQACSIACRRGMRACGLQPSLSQKIIFYRVWKWRVRGYMTSNWLWLTNQFRTRTVWYKLTLSETTFSQGPFFHFSMMVQ